MASLNENQNMPALREAQDIILVLQKCLSDLSTLLSHPEQVGERMRTFSTVQAGFGALEAAILSPLSLVTEILHTYHLPFTLAKVVDLGFVEIVSSAGAEGITAADMEELTGIPKGKVSRFLRLLAGRGIFQEILPERWAHTRHSKALDSGLPYQIIKEEPIKRYSMGAPLPALITLVESGGKAGAASFDAVRDPHLAKSYKVTETAFNLAYKTDKSFFNWMASVDGGLRMAGFVKAMTALTSRDPDLTIYPWTELGEGATVVDVGGGSGSILLSILPHGPNIKTAIVQDQGPVIERARTFWQQRDPEALSSGRVLLQAHNFFGPQPVKAADVYLLRAILHDWADEECIVILKNLHDAAGPNTHLLVMDAVIDHACHDIGDIGIGAVEGAFPKPFPPPLPANGGRAAEFSLNLDMHMMCLVNGQERTHTHLKQIAAEAGWKAKRVYAVNASPHKISEFIKE